MDSQPLAMRHHLSSYLAGRISLDDLKERLVNATWDNEGAKSSEEMQLAYDIERVLAEASSGYLTPEELRAGLQNLLDRAELRTPA
jgi:hypothetical protein